MDFETSSRYFLRTTTNVKKSPIPRHDTSNIPTKKSKSSIKIEYEKNTIEEHSKIKDEDQSKDNSSKDDWKPANWDVIYENIKEMRKERNAIVDLQGCEKTADETLSPGVVRYQVLISLMLSSQTKDPVTFATMEKLKQHGLTIPNILKTSEDKVGELINKVGFWKKKVVFIKKATDICHSQYNDDIPNTLNGLLSLPGVGPKMAHICMNVAWKEITGIGVDTHVHRISNWLKLVKKPTKSPEQTRKELESWLPKSEWQEFNVLLVGFGQQICFPVKPSCQICLNRSICPVADEKMSGKKKKKK